MSYVVQESTATIWLATKPIHQTHLTASLTSLSTPQWLHPQAKNNSNWYLYHTAKENSRKSFKTRLKWFNKHALHAATLNSFVKMLKIMVSDNDSMFKMFFLYSSCIVVRIDHYLKNISHLTFADKSLDCAKTVGRILCRWSRWKALLPCPDPPLVQTNSNAIASVVFGHISQRHSDPRLKNIYKKSAACPNPSQTLNRGGNPNLSRPH